VCVCGYVVRCVWGGASLFAKTTLAEPWPLVETQGSYAFFVLFFFASLLLLRWVFSFCSRQTLSFGLYLPACYGMVFCFYSG
jgi:hypothetical protein